MRAYHGTNAVFDKFDPKFIGTTTDEGYLGRGFYFSTDPRVAEPFAYTLEVELDISNPFVAVDPHFGRDKRKIIRNALGLDITASPQEVTLAAICLGYDSIILDYSPTGYHHQEIVVFDPSRIRILERRLNTEAQERVSTRRMNDLRLQYRNIPFVTTKMS